MSARLDILAPHLIEHLLRAPEDAPTQAVSSVLARGELRAMPRTDVDTAMLAWFGLSSFEGLADISAALDFAAHDGDAHWLRADPVHLRADATRVTLFDTDSVGLAADESDALLAHLNAGFAGQALRFERGHSPSRWYLRAAAPQALELASPRALRGSAVEDSLSALRRAGALNRVMTEAQMVLYGAPANDARGAAGRAPINSVWFWGGGSAPAIARGTRGAVLGDDDFLAALAHRAGLTHQRAAKGLEEVLHDACGDVLLLDHTGFEQCDVARFADEILAPASAALSRGRLAEVVIHAEGAELSLTRGARWRLWRRATVFLDALRRMREGEAR
ncbi:MAG: hypothetical protein IPM80_07960 [Proteobacteria bacterium]|nr:hypothetical protein [Pseudomonadota bacterium]